MEKDVSIIITAHSEGLIAHKTMLSIFDNIRQLHGLSYEIIIGLDAPDEYTSNYFRSYSDDERVTVLRTNFGEPSQNRNNAVNHASGKYIMLIDGDDLLSPNFIKTAYSLASSSEKPVLIHPEAHLQFGIEEKNCVLWLMEGSFSKAEDALIMSYWNRWTNVQFGRREIFEQHPFVPTGNGYGYEDFHFNSETRSSGISHKVAPETVLFYRKKPTSVQTQHISGNASVAETQLLDIDFIKSIDISKYPKPPGVSKLKRSAASAFKASYAIANRIDLIKKLATPAARRSLYNRNIKLVPSWLIDQWKNINSIENQLYPTVGEVAKLEFHPLSFNQHWTSFGMVYKNLVDQITRRSDYLFLPPEIKVGGTEKLMFNYVRALHEVRPEWQITVIGKRPNAEMYNIPESVDFIDFDEATKDLGVYEKNILWSRLFIQLGAKKIHIVNNKRWLDWARKHKPLLSHGYKVYVSLFMQEFTHEKDRVLTLADPEIREIHSIITKVFTDNKKVIDQAMSNNAFDLDKFAVHYQPESSSLIQPKTIDPDKPLRILWASRLSYQKRPDLLKEIATALVDSAQIDAYGSIEKNQFTTSYFKDSPVNYKGAFSNIDSIPVEDYDLYLYTSDTDGIPNILLEMAARGLPIVASDVGGINEFIQNNISGVLVKNDPGMFKNAITELVSNPQRTTNFVKKSQSKLQSQHSWSAFVDKIRHDIT